MRTAAKVLKFPLSGIARDIDYRKAYIPEEEVSFATPFAVNVRGSDTFHRRNRGGSRPGLAKITGVISESGGTWQWPNGETLCWPNGANITYSFPQMKFTAPDGSPMVDPHRYFTPHASKGAVPSNVRASAAYRARLFVAKDSQWYASRQGDFTDWDYGGDMEDVGRASTGNVAMAAEEGEHITAMMPMFDKSLYIATSRAIWRLDGEPTAGTLNCLSPYVGCVSTNAWCSDGTNIWFVSNQGLYVIAPGSIPMLVSARLPEEFRGITSALLIYDPEENGLHVFTEIGSGATATTRDWYYDIPNKAFWKVVIPAAMRPVATAHAMVDGINVCAFRGSDGHWRRFDDASTTDDGTAFTSRVAIGPVRTSLRDDMDGLVAELDVTTAEGSGNVTIKVYSEHSPESVVVKQEAGTANASFAAKAGWNNVYRPRVRGAWTVVEITSTGRWGFESITSVVHQLGRLR